jgi:hypothetical protein
MARRKLSAVALKEILWTAMNDVRLGRLDPAAADSMATSAREILRTVKVQMAICTQSANSVPDELVDFAKPPANPLRAKLRAAS